MSGEDVRLWGTPSESIRPKRRLKDIGDSGVRKVREAIQTYSDPSLAKVADNYQPEKLWEANLAFFKIRSVLGSGSFGTVFRAYNKKEKSRCAIKVVRTYKRDVKMITSEIRSLGTLHHPNIVHLYCACITNDGVLTLIMPALYPLGRIVLEILAEQKEDRETTEVFQILPEDIVHNIIQQVCRGLAFMHRHKFVHRDLKADNFLFDKEGTIKIADFGLSRKYTSAGNNLGLMKTPCGTKLFMAPEVARRYSDNDAELYDIRAETWAVGICTLELLYGMIPFERNLNPDVEEEIAGLQKMNTVRDVDWNKMYANGEQLRKKLSKHCKDFIDSCLKLKPEDRPTVAELFIQKFWMLQPPIPNAELFAKLFGTCGEDNLKYVLEKKHRRKLEEHRRMNNNPANPIKLLNDRVMCISLSLGSSEERFFKKFVVRSYICEKEAEGLFHDMLFGYLYDEQINLYDFIYISTGAIKAFRRVKELDAKRKKDPRERENTSSVAAAEKPEVVSLQGGGECVISWHKELFSVKDSPRRRNGEKPEVPPRMRRSARNR